MSKTVIGVMGPGEGATTDNCEHAYTLGKLIAEQEWALLTGGRNTGVMNAASRGAHEADGLVIGILPSEDRKGTSKYVDIPICTGMGSARNNINVLSSDVVVACGNGAGTTSEVMFSLKAQKPLILLDPDTPLINLLDSLPYPNPEIKATPSKVVHCIDMIIQNDLL